MQPVTIDRDGELRFKRNKIVDNILSMCISKLGYGLDDLPWDLFSQEDIDQFFQLLGYRLSGYAEIELVSEGAKEKALEALEEHKRLKVKAGTI